MQRGDFGGPRPGVQQPDRHAHKNCRVRGVGF
jgi:hypothetical protein